MYHLEHESEILSRSYHTPHCLLKYFYALRKEDVSF